jgi:hypothetical protein
MMMDMILQDFAQKCFKNFVKFDKEESAFVDDYHFFSMYMNRERKSNEMFIPSMDSKSFQSVIDRNNKDAKGLKKSFRIYHVVKQIIVDLQEWNKPAFSERDRNALLKWAVEYGGVDIDTFCNEFVSCSIGYNNVRQKIAEIINTTECPPLWRHW